MFLILRISEALISGAWSIGNAVAFTPNFQKGVTAADSVIRLLKRTPKIKDSDNASAYGWVVYLTFIPFTYKLI